ncbi:MAG: DPP IV N-terminal domain-containing protein [Muribaculaceae bacterium]|nr:DPP IV N-terminal domain-containing protein [Muribaculaceae bacterium]
MIDIRKGILSLATLASAVAWAGELTISDYCDQKLAVPNRIKEITAMPDGLNYAAISDDESSIELFSYKTGKKVGELFNLNEVKGDLKIDSFEGFSVSDNGKKVLLWNKSEKIYRYSFRAEYYVYDTFRKTLARVSDKGPQRCATISHDGRYVAYERDNNIFISNIDYKTDNAITTDGESGKIINGSPDWSYEEEFDLRNSIRWSADDTILAYLKFDERNVPAYTFDVYKGFCDDDPLKDLYPATFSYKYPLAGYDCSIVSVHSYNLDSRVTKKMDIPIADTDYVPSIEFGADGSKLMVMVVNKEQNNLKLYNVNPSSTVARLIYTDSSDTWLSPKSYQMIDYGTTDFVIASEKSGQNHLYLYDYAGTLKKQLTSGNYNVTAYYGRDKKGTHFLQSTALGPIYRSIVSIDARGVSKMLSGKTGTSSAQFSKNLDYYIMTFSSSTVPTQYTLCNSSGIKLADLELNTSYAQKYSNAPKMEFLTVKNDAGQEMNAFMIKPVGFDGSKKYPLLMYQYNGPESQEVLDRWRMEGIFYLASQGYVIACVDGRGTGNRNTEWSRCVYKNLGDLETKDQLAAIKHFASLPFIDSNRLGCFGWSYGGYMSLMEAGAKGSPLKAAVAMAAVTHWEFYDAIYTERFMQTPSQNPNGYFNSSALNHTSDVKSKLLVISGSDDDNVHMYNTLKYTSKLSSEGKVCDMMIYAGFEHSLGMCDARVQLFRKINDFLETNLKN